MPTILWELPIPSTAILGTGPVLETRLGRAMAIRFSYESEDGDGQHENTMIFERTVGVKITYYAARYADMLEAYDRVLDCGPTAWVKGLTDNVRRNGFQAQALKHLMIMFDDGPCYEFVCEAFRVESP